MLQATATKVHDKDTLVYKAIRVFGCNKTRLEGALKLVQSQSGIDNKQKEQTY